MKKIFFLFMTLALIALVGGAADASTKDKGDSAIKPTTLYIAYTCNTWGQLKPCPS